MDNTFERVKGIIGRLRNVLKCQKCFTLKEDLNMSFYHQCDHFYCSKCVIEQDLCPVCKNVSDKPRTIASDKNMLILYKSIINYELPSKIDFDVMYEGYKQSKVQYQKVKKSERIEKGCVENEKPVNDNSEMACQKLDAKSSKIKSIESKKRNSHKNSRPIGSLTATLTREGKVNPYSLTGTTEKIRTSTEQLMPLNVNVPDTSKTVITNKSVVTPETSKILNMNTPGSSKTLHITTPKSSKTVRNVTPTSANASNTNTASNSKSLTKLNINKRNPKGETQLHLACKKKDFKWMKDLIAAGANPNAKDNAGWSPLHDSVFSGNVAVIEFLLENGANVNLPGLENTTALHEAIAKGNKRIVDVLLKYGADVNMMNIHRETPMDLVRNHNLTELKELLEAATGKYNLVESRERKEKEESLEGIILYKHNLPIEEDKMVNKFVEKFPVQITSSITTRVHPTHIIVSGPQVDLTWGLLSSTVNGCWIVAVQWIKDCLKENSPKSTSSYILTKDQFAGFEKARNNLKFDLPKLFCGCHFYFGGQFDIYTINNVTVGKAELKYFVEKNGGKILKRCPDPESLTLEKTIPYHVDVTGSLKETSHYIIYQTEKWDPIPKYAMSHMKTLPIEWLLASVLKFELIDPKSHTGNYL